MLQTDCKIVYRTMRYKFANWEIENVLRVLEIHVMEKKTLQENIY